MQCIFTAGWAAALCRVSSDQRSAYSFHQQQKPKNSGREGVNIVENKLSSQGTLPTRYPGKLRCFKGRGASTYHLVATEYTYYPENVDAAGCRRGEPATAVALLDAHADVAGLTFS